MLATNKCAAFGALLTKLSLAIFAIAALAFTSRSLADPGFLYVTDLADGSIKVYAPDGTPSTFATGLISPQGICFDQYKNLYVADAGDGGAGNGVIYKYDVITQDRITVKSGLSNPIGLTQDGAGILVSENGIDQVRRIPLNPDGTQAGPDTLFQSVTGPLGLISHGVEINGVPSFYRYIANGPSVIQVAPDKTTTDIDPGDDSRSVAVEIVGNVYVSSGGGHVTKIPADGSASSEFANGFTLPTGMDFRPAKFGGDTDRVGYLYVADTTTGTISQISQTGTKTNFVTGAGNPNFIAFETADPPVPVTGVASNVNTTTATLNGTVDPNGLGTTYHFQYGLTTAYGNNTAISGAGNGLDPVPVSANLTGLAPGTVYHFRLVCSNGGPIVYGADSTFTTFVVPPTPTPTPKPIVTTGSATGLSETAETLHGTVNPNGSATTYHFEYGATTSYGNSTTVGNLSSGFTPVAVSAALTGLDVGATYHYRLTATNVGGTTNGADKTFTTTAPVPDDSALNISTRVDVETGDNVGIGGFIIDGTDPKVVVIRGIGPSLTTADPPVPGAISDPFLELHDSTGAIVTTNDNWMDNNSADQQTLTDSGLAPTNGLESAIVRTLDPGAYTAILKGANDVTGIGLVEVYDLDDPTVTGELKNLSTRGLVGTDDDVLIGGVILGPVGGADAPVVIRAIGPSLANATPPVANPLMDPVLELHGANGDVVAANDNWQEAYLTFSDYSADVTASQLAPTSPAEAAIYIVLPAGNYTAVVSGSGGTTGVGLVEIYHVPLVP